jgi:hypothetical protein
MSVASNEATDPKLPTKATLAWPVAILNSLFNVSADFYPRIVVDGSIRSLQSKNIFHEMGDSSGWASLDPEGIDKALELARQSLNEVKSQTEYQDQKATRLLTVTTFLSAFSGVLFTRFEDCYEFSQIFKLPEFTQVAIWFTYGLFGAFILLALSGAIVIFHATRTRFKYPSFDTAHRQELDPISLEFYSGLISVRPRAWLNAWVVDEPTSYGFSKLKIRKDLKARYLHNLVSETYLVAAKTADKLRYLQPGQSILAWSLRCLFVWLILGGLVSVNVPAIKRPLAPMAVRIIGPVSLQAQAGPAGAATAPVSGGLEAKGLAPGYQKTTPASVGHP